MIHPRRGASWRSGSRAAKDLPGRSTRSSARLGSRTARPITRACSLHREQRQRAIDLLAATTTQKPTPMLKVWYISAAGIRALAIKRHRRRLSCRHEADTGCASTRRSSQAVG